MWRWHIKIIEWFHWVQSEWSPLRTYSSSLQQSGTPRAGGQTLTIVFHRYWNTSLPLRCLVPFGICVYFQSSCHLVATCSTNQQCWKRTSPASCLINYFAGCASSVLWEVAKFIKVSLYSTSPCWILHYRHLLFSSIIYFCLFNLSSYRSYPSPLIIPIPLFSYLLQVYITLSERGWPAGMWCPDEGITYLSSIQEYIPANFVSSVFWLRLNV